MNIDNNYNYASNTSYSSIMKTMIIRYYMYYCKIRNSLHQQNVMNNLHQQNVMKQQPTTRIQNRTQHSVHTNTSKNRGKGKRLWQCVQYAPSASVSSSSSSSSTTVVLTNRSRIECPSTALILRCASCGGRGEGGPCVCVLVLHELTLDSATASNKLTAVCTQNRTYCRKC